MTNEAPLKATYDDTLPRNGIIFGIAVGSAVILGLLHFGFQAYFVDVTEAEVYVKVLSRGGDEVRALREAEARKLHQGKVPIEQAMVALGQEGRGSIPLIAPEQSDEHDALKGWAFHPGFDARKAIIEARAAKQGIDEGEVDETTASADGDSE